jgi:Na+(H+)/acetate symporter ActP
MQFLILLVGVLVFVFYQFVQPPIFFNDAAKSYLENSPQKEKMEALEEEHIEVFEEKRSALYDLLQAKENNNEFAADQLKEKINALSTRQNDIKNSVAGLVTKANPEAEDEDTDYVFISFVIKYLPKGVVGLLLAVIFSAAMSSTAGELNALASTTTVDIYKRSLKKTATDKHYLIASRVLTLIWGLLAIGFATFFSLLDNLIEAVNIIGSLFYGTILGIFLAAFYIKSIGSRSIFIAAIIAELIVIGLFILTMLEILSIGYLWYNLVGCALVIIIAYALSRVFPEVKITKK